MAYSRVSPPTPKQIRLPFQIGHRGRHLATTGQDGQDGQDGRDGRDGQTGYAF